ncbi:hypothetical protein MBLNU13_g10956t1 [Cladosporium sp. NU13]
MVAIYVPVFQPAEQVYLHVPHAFHLDRKIAFMLRALHACNEGKDNKITCLGTAVTCHRRCRNPLRTTKLMAVLGEMVEAAEKPYALLGDLRFLAAEWTAGLSCHLHGAQKGIAMVALGAVAVYRLEAKEENVFPGLLNVWKFVLEQKSSYCCAKGHAGLETKEGAAKCPAKNGGELEIVSERSLETPMCLEEKPDESDAVSEGLLKTAKSPAKKTEESNALTEGSLIGRMVKQWKKFHDLETALLSLTDAVLKFCASLAWLYLSILLIYLIILLLLEKK